MASQTITGPELQYTQDNKHAVALSGIHPISTSAVEHFNFQTGSGYLVADLYCNGAVKISDPSVGRTTVWFLSFNEVIVSGLKTDSAAADFAGPTIHNKIIIPPFTTVKLEAYSESDAADRLTSAIIIGTVYEHLPVRN